MRQPPQRALSSSWSLQPPFLLAAPFAAFAVAALLAGTPFTGLRVCGTTALFGLCAGSLFCGVKRKTNDGAVSSLHMPASEPARITIQQADLADFVLSGARYPGQFKAALTLACIAFAALVIVVCLLAGQIQRSGRITMFGLALAVFLVFLPAMLSLHIRLARVRMRLTNADLLITTRRGLLGSAEQRWRRAELRSIELVSAVPNTVVHLVIRCNAQSTTIPVAGFTVAEVNARLLAASTQA